jgi:hypothetical protein
MYIRLTVDGDFCIIPSLLHSPRAVACSAVVCANTNGHPRCLHVLHKHPWESISARIPPSSILFLWHGNKVVPGPAPYGLLNSHNSTVLKCTSCSYLPWIRSAFGKQRPNRTVIHGNTLQLCLSTSYMDTYAYFMKVCNENGNQRNQTCTHTDTLACARQHTSDALARSIPYW